MVFSEPRFLLFFAVVFGLHWALRSDSPRKRLLLVASYVFYGAWDWRFLFLIFGSTVVDYFVGLKLQDSTSPRARKAWVTTSLVANLGVLGFFKYFDFFVESMVDLLGLLGVEATATSLGIALPVGISFFTFQTMSYSIDVYRRELEATRRFDDFALFVAFFPQLVAGPIVRAVTFIPQLSESHHYRKVPFRAALGIFLAGFIKKACVADQIASLVDTVYASPEAFTALAQTQASMLYAAQVYCDFSGYSEMAIACAMLLGFRLPDNFDFPFFTRNITEFWQRWHISLSSWLRDYLYIPLGGNRGGRWFSHRNLLLTMVLGGLWHGAGWTYIIFGATQGVALVVHREWREKVGYRFPPVVGWVMTLATVMVAFIFFRSQTVADGLLVMRGVFTHASEGVRTLPEGTSWLIAGLFALHALAWIKLPQRIGGRLPDPVLAVCWGVIAAVALLFVPVDAKPFIYFQF